MSVLSTTPERVGRHEPSYTRCVVASPEIVQSRFGIAFFAGELVAIRVTAGDRNLAAIRVVVRLAQNVARRFSEPRDWIFASPVQLGRLPYSYNYVWMAFLGAGELAGIGEVTTRR